VVALTGSSFRVLTFNCLWRGAARERLDAIGPLLDETGVDFVCLQEVTRRRSIALLEGHLGTYQPAVFRPYGIAVMGGLVSFARRPIEGSSYEVFRGRGPHWTLGWADRLLRKGFQTTWLRIDALPLIVINTHLLANYDEDWAPDNRFAREQRSDLEQLAYAVDRLDREALVIVAGDFNVPATSPMFGAFTSRCGLHDAFAFAPGPAPPTYRPSSGRPLDAIDRILYRHPSGRPLRVAARLRFEERIRLANDRLAFASDHLAVEAGILLDGAGEPAFED
jgi:endonuclease/exonuclease/phosphatase family metal-dependent hydrolase